MKNLRIIARLDIKNNFLIKGIQLEGLRKIGAPEDFAFKYFSEGVDEILLLDAVASYYDRNSLSETIDRIAKDIFIPITVGGGIRKLEDIDLILKNGADKVAINTSAVRNLDFITQASRIYGSQSIVGSVVAKYNGSIWEAYIENGREPTGLNCFEWIQELQKAGIGELILTSLDRDGTRRGFDLNLYKEALKYSQVPIIASGGAGNSIDCENLLCSSDVDGIAIASAFHYNKIDIFGLKHSLNSATSSRYIRF
ncbi:imidazole glycerol phosphate synthase cyclase subunit [Synechococcus sp. AH-551-N23]|nr:imidazole glycerol phosphate synthase cyclase subunit [Synechococcus sp. AH-551-N23]